MSIYAKLQDIQDKFKVPKNQIDTHIGVYAIINPLTTPFTLEVMATENK